MSGLKSWAGRAKAAITRPALVAVTTTLFLVVVVGPASARTIVTPDQNGDGSEAAVNMEVDGDSPPTDGKPRQCLKKDYGTGAVSEVLCVTAAGTWSNVHNCYAHDATDQFPMTKNAMIQKGMVDADGNLTGIVLACDGDVNPWVAWALPGVASPQLVAQVAVSQMHLVAPQVATTRAGTMQLVKWPMWMWVADPGESTTGPAKSTAAVGAVSVTAIGTLDKTVWDMGDGHSVTCAGAAAAGTPYEDSYGGGSSPTCGYTYQKHADTKGSWYTMTVTAYWTVSWSGGGQSGTIPIQVHRSMPIQVGEYQTVVVPNPPGKG